MFLNFLLHKFHKKSKIDYQNKTVEIDDLSEKYMKDCSVYTFKTELEMWAVINSLRYILNQNIEGDIVETGVWRGGTIILIKKVLSELNIKKKIIGFDTFEEGFEEPGEYDLKVNYGFRGREDLYVKKFDHKSFKAAGLDEAINNIKNSNLNMDDMHLVKGKIEDTLKKQNINKISFLLLDTDYYESTLQSMNELYEKVSHNGIIYIDDYGNWGGARKAVDEFFYKKKIKPFLIRSSFASRLFIKNI